jgi:hypothetical protein
LRGRAWKGGFCIPVTIPTLSSLAYFPPENRLESRIWCRQTTLTFCRVPRAVLQVVILCTLMQTRASIQPPTIRPLNIDGITIWIHDTGFSSQHLICATQRLLSSKGFRNIFWCEFDGERAYPNIIPTSFLKLSDLDIIASLLKPSVYIYCTHCTVLFFVPTLTQTSCQVSNLFTIRSYLSLIAAFSLFLSVRQNTRIGILFRE